MTGVQTCALPISPKPDPADRKAQEQAQQEADAAQRERMRGAQAKPAAQNMPPKPLPKAAADEVSPNESAIDRERRIANEAWLRRVPDEPGGLLRAKFKLEERRRDREDDR